MIKSSVSGRRLSELTYKDIHSVTQHQLELFFISCISFEIQGLVVMYGNKFLPKLSENLLEILEDNEFYDITIEVDDGILVHIKLPNILPETFQIILRYIYGGRLSLEEYDTSDIIKILITANELNLQELITHLQLFLIENKKNWMEQNFNLIFKTSFNNDSFLELQNFCTELMSNEPEKIFNSIDFISLSEKSLISLIQHDKIQMNVIQVWENVLKWGIAQNPGLPSDPSSYSKNDFNALMNTLQQFIPFIKFFNLNNKEFLSKVYPYKKIIPKDLRENLIQHFIDRPNNKPESNIPRIITFQHTELISKWIDRLKITDKINNLYEFKLILRGSRDGFSASKFHKICDYKSHTILVIKIKDSNEILGGYNPIIWKSDGSCGSTEDSFVFSFKNKENVENHILSRVKVAGYAIVNDPNRGPVFGAYEFLLDNNNSVCVQNPVYYEKLINDRGIFSVEEYEIFQIKKD
ncbi:carbohydrate-binding module family 13 protein [Rhizophagus clarus]|uniref:Carbohydrate-binding module family 13 protein n=1 Tax=Rhizophagus clarus TaxID=94130 RepID=A0A8H3M6I6_9GLOM|nr:carbohydrate-binding module family 13 protein [Rhizophagus clarus]